MAKALVGTISSGLHLPKTRDERIAPAAYEHYVQAIELLNRDGDNAVSAAALLRKASAIDPTSAVIYAGLAEAQLQEYDKLK